MDLLKDDNNNFILENGDFCAITGSKLVFQMVVDRLRSVAREWFLNYEGLPYFTDILVKERRQDVEALFIDVITSVRGVDAVESLSLIIDTDTRLLSIEAKITTSFNDTIEIRQRIQETPPVQTDNILRDELGEPLQDAVGEPLQDLGV